LLYLRVVENDDRRWEPDVQHWTRVANASRHAGLELFPMRRGSAELAGNEVVGPRIGKGDRALHSLNPLLDVAHLLGRRRHAQ
jgi:hypothetical protein